MRGKEPQRVLRLLGASWVSECSISRWCITTDTESQDRSTQRGRGLHGVIAWMYFSIALSHVLTVDYIITYLMFRNRYCPAHPLFRNRHLVIMLLIHQYFAKLCTISTKLVSIFLSAPKSYHQNSKYFTFLIALCFIFHWYSIDSVFYIFILLY